MASSDVVTLEDGTFEQEVLKSDTPVLVDFWATWCGPCKAIAPLVDELAKEYKGKLKVAKLDIDSHQQVPQKYGIRSIPTLLVFKGGRVVDTIVGSVPKSKLVDAVKKVVELGGTITTPKDPGPWPAVVVMPKVPKLCTRSRG